ncbi:MAG: TRAP transporter substrate-binding protein DctP [Ignavibacteriae bacterium]|nr:TRAP transporter substrate-binding protein DctP [Ignavibacteriota bacterium]
MKRLSNIFLLITLILATSFSQNYTIKFATIAPENSTWYNVMKDYDAAVRKESGGRLKFQIYAGGVSGDEKAVLRKIRIGQLHSGGFTGVAMGEIAPVVRILDSPFLVRNNEEVDFLASQFENEFNQAFEKGGFVLLGWAEVGFVHVFTNTPIEKPDDLKRIKLWTWEGDPVAEAAFRALGISPIPIAVTDVLTSLQTGLIDAFYSTPLATIALQWHTRAKYMVETPISNAAGAVLLSKRYYDTLPADLQEILIRNGREHLSKLVKLIRTDNEKSIAQLKKAGIKIQEVKESELATYIEAGAKARRSLVGKLYSEEFLDKVEKAIDEYRKNNRASK